MLFFRKPCNNYIAIAIAVIAGTLLYINAPSRATAGMAFIIIPWIALVLGIITALGFALSYYLIPKWAWVVTLLGILFILVSSVQYFLIEV